jgi:hypothetical protein
MDETFIPRQESANTLEWLQPLLAAENPHQAILQAIEAEGTPVYLTDYSSLNQLIWWLTKGHMGYIPLVGWTYRLAAVLLHVAVKRNLRFPGKGFFWYPVLQVSPTWLSYGVHHWRKAQATALHYAWRKQVDRPDSLQHSQLHAMTAEELLALQSAVQQEVDALMVTFQLLKKQT